MSRKTAAHKGSNSPKNNANSTATNIGGAANEGFVWLETKAGGKLDKEGISTLYRSLGIKLTSTECEDLLGSFDIDANGTVCAKDYASSIGAPTYSNDVEEDFKPLFNLLDRRKEGKLDKEDVKNLMSIVEENISDSTISKLMRNLSSSSIGSSGSKSTVGADTKENRSGSKSITLEDFVKAVYA